MRVTDPKTTMTPTECTHCGYSLRHVDDCHQIWPDGTKDDLCEDCQGDLRWCYVCEETVDIREDSCYHMICLEDGLLTGPGCGYEPDETTRKELKAAFNETCTRAPGLAAAVFYGLTRPGHAWRNKTLPGFNFLHATGGLGPSFLRAGAFRQWKYGLNLSEWVHWAEADAKTEEQERAVLAASILTSLQPYVPLDNAWMKMVCRWAEEWLGSNAILTPMMA